MEQTFVAIKPDGVQRGLTGEILRRFEQAGLKIVAMKMVQVSEELANKHYPTDREELIVGIGEKTLAGYKELEIDAKKELGTSDPKQIGELVRSWLADYITSGPVVAMVLESPHAIELVRKLVGGTMPLTASPGTIRGDLSYDSPHLANSRNRPVKNMIHASGNKEEAQYEISLWFEQQEISGYQRADEAPMA